MINSILSCIGKESIARRVLSRSTVDDESGCWLWHGTLDRNGYGAIRVLTPDGRRATGAHRAAWLSMVGDITDGELEIDHLCRVRNCVNPAHLELVTAQENSRRSNHPRTGRPRGHRPGCGIHGFEDSYEATNAAGCTGWVCRICARRRMLEYKARKLAAAQETQALAA